MDDPTKLPEEDRLAGVERWLSSPIRLAALVGMAVVVATAATSLGEVELRRAWDVGPDEADLVMRQGVIWTAWALLASPLVALALHMARHVRPWPLTLACHLPIAAVVGSAFLVLENELTVWVQGEERTERIRERAEWIESRSTTERGAPRGRDERRIGERGGRREGEDGRAGADRTAREFEGAPRQEARPPEESRPEEFDRDESRRRRGDRRRGSSNPAAYGFVTGDLVDDFERRWTLRVPRYALIYFALIGIGLGIRSFLVGRARERETVVLEVRASQLEAALTEAKLSALKGQLHPHFLFNALHSIGGLIRSDRPSEALTALASIGDLLRTSLDAGGEQFVPLGREVELIERYLAVEKLRLGDRLGITIDVPQELRDAEVPAFIAQPLAENAVKHGIAPRAGGGAVTIRARSEGGTHLILDIENDGPGYRANGREGVGLPHVRSRLAALFDDDARLEMTCLEGSATDGTGTRARLVLPLDDLTGVDA